jgi:hypothetical protein
MREGPEGQGAGLRLGVSGRHEIAMMGTKARLITPVRAISLDELVPPNHFYRHLDRVLDLAFVRDLVQDCYAPYGRPSVDPVVFFKIHTSHYPH